MTTSNEHYDAQIAAIKARHEAIAAKFSDPAVTRIDEGLDFGVIVITGLSPVYVDPIGRLWKVSVADHPRNVVAEMIFDTYPRRSGGAPPQENRHEGLVAALERGERPWPSPPVMMDGLIPAKEG